MINTMTINVMINSASILYIIESNRMTDIIDEFTSPANVAKVTRILIERAKHDGNARTITQDDETRMRALMLEFIHGPYGGGLLDIWSGTDPWLYVRQMNGEFMQYIDLRKNGSLHVTQDSREAMGAGVDMVVGMDPLRARERMRKRAEASSRRHVPHRTEVSCACESRPLVEYANPIMGPIGELPRFDPSSGQWVAREHPDAPARRIFERESDAVYDTMSRDLGSSVHLTTRDDEAGDAGKRAIARPWRDRVARVRAPYSVTSRVGIDERLANPQAGSGDVQYHLVELDTRMAILNDEKTIPMGYGTAQEQLAEDARVAARYSWWRPREGVIPRANYTRLTRGITPSGRVTLDDERAYSHDIMSTDSRGFIMPGRRVRP